VVAYGTIRSNDSIGASTITTATGAPINSDGATGDYWLDGTAHVLYGPKSGGPLPPEYYAVDPTSSATAFSTGNYTYGLKVRFATSGIVSALRFYRPGNSTATSRTLRLYRGNVLIATTTSSGESGAGWKTVPLATPVAVDAGVDYITAYHTAGSYYVEITGTTPPSYSPTQITNLNSCWENSLNYPSNNVAGNWFADLVFSQSQWPTAIKSAPF
jgi:hypothetical protein